MAFSFAECLQFWGGAEVAAGVSFGLPGGSLESRMKGTINPPGGHRMSGVGLNRSLQKYLIRRYVISTTVSSPLWGSTSMRVCLVQFPTASVS